MLESPADASAVPRTASPAMPRRSARAEAAAEFYRRLHGRCFWHCPRDLEITEARIPFVIRGLKAHGGREGFRLAAELERTSADA